MAALDGIRVIDLTHFEAGPFCSEMLALMGADVIKIERTSGPRGRTRFPRPEGDNPAFDAFNFLMLNSNKRSVCIDLKTDQGRELFTRLLKDADVFVESQGPGVVERLGFDYEALKAINPRIIFAQIKGYNADSPRANYKTMNSQAIAMSGVMSITGEPDSEPLQPGPHVSDTGTGLHMALGIVAALYQRTVTGHGQHVRVAMQEASINFIRPAIAQALSTGKPAKRIGNRATQPGVGRELYVTHPGGPNDYVMLGLQRTIEDWGPVFDLIGRPDARTDPRFKDRDSQIAHAEEFHDLIESWTKSISKHEAMEKMASLGIPAGAVQDTDDLFFNEPALRESNMFVTVNHPQRGEMLTVGFPIKMQDGDVAITPAPLAGQHTREVLSELLDLKPEELDALKESGVISDH